MHAPANEENWSVACSQLLNNNVDITDNCLGLQIWNDNSIIDTSIDYTINW